jgi:signal recognition particle GTPase
MLFFPPGGYEIDGGVVPGVEDVQRISRGAGVELTEVSQFLKQFETTRDMMRAVGGMGMMGKIKLMKGLMGGGLANMGMPGGQMMKTKKSGFMEKKDRNKKKKRR